MRDPLLQAVESGQCALVEQLLQGGCPITTSDEEGSQAIHYAAELGHELIVSLLLKHGAEGNPLDGWSLTPLLWAAREGHAGVVEILLDGGADPRARGIVDGLLKPLNYAARGGHLDVISVITQRDPEVINFTESSAGYTALHYAAEHNQVASIDLLVEAGANLELQDLRGHTALHIAAYFPDCEAAVLALLRHGEDTEKRDYNSLTPLLVAIKERHYNAAMALIAAGADVCAAAYYSALELAIHTECIDIVRLLVQHGASAIEPRLDRGFTPLHWAAWCNNAPAIDFLVESGANMEEENLVMPGGAWHAQNLEAITALVHHGANIHARETGSGNTPLHVAAMRKSVFARVARSPRGTPLHVASNCHNGGSAATVDALLKAGADETVVNGDGRTPADLLEHTLNGIHSSEDAKPTLALLTNAPRDRAYRWWARRRLFVLCHAFSDRVRLVSPGGDIGDCSSLFRAIDPTTRSTTGGAPEVREGELGNDEESCVAIGISRDFRGAMGRLIRLQVDVFRTRMEFL